jgi:hypothetical protein
VKEKKVLLTVHVTRKARDQFKTSVKNHRKDMSEVAEQLMRMWIEKHSTDPGRERVQLDQAAEILARAVCTQLAQNHRWATEAIIDAGMGLPGSDVFDKRTGHFSLEKQECGREFARWLLHRVVHFLNQGKKVFLVCDSGTTIFWFLKTLGEAISEYFKCTDEPRSQALPSITGDKLTGLTVITNNIPGAEAFVTYASEHTLSVSSKEAHISDLVECRLLAGVLLPEYVALTGEDTNHDLEALWKRIISQRIKPTPVFIGVATGNWLSIEHFEGIALPHLLARGRGHGPFKKKLLDVCDEIFVLAPLGKIFLKSVDALNTKLHYSQTASEPHLRSYEVVPMPPGKAEAIKLVSTYRDRISSILKNHSSDVRDALGRFADNPEQQQRQASMPIPKVDHLLFRFDHFSEEPPETQTEIELPHPQTRSAEFKKEFFSIR